MLHTIAIANYRSLRDIVVPLSRLTVITGPNGSGKSNLYRTLRLLGEIAAGTAPASITREGGLASVLWAGPETISPAMKRGSVPIQGGPRKERVSLRLGFAADDFSYAIDFGLPEPSSSAFAGDPEVKRECIWHGPKLRPSAVVVDRRGHLVTTRDRNGESIVLTDHIAMQDSMLTQLADPVRAPEVLLLRDSVRSWRFYDHFRTDLDAPARQAQIGTRTPVLSHDGRDVAAAIQTIREIGDSGALDAAVDDAFPGARLSVTANAGRFEIRLEQHGLLRSLSQAEMSDGTLRYLLWIAALLTPRPPGLMVLNEPETSLHPDLLPALARLIGKAAGHTQVWVVSHASRLIAALSEIDVCRQIALEKVLGETRIADQGPLDGPAWSWPAR